MGAENTGRCRGRARGFTLVEMLVGVTVTAVLAALLLPAVSKARDAALAAKCQSNLHQIGIGAAVYLSEYNNWTMPSDVDPGLDRRVSWNNYLFVHGLSQDPMVFRCPSIPKLDANVQGQYSPVRSPLSPWPYNRPEYDALGSGSYVMNVIRPNATNSYASTSHWNGATQLQSQGLDPRRLRGWTDVAPGGFDGEHFPLRHDRAAGPADSIYIADHRPDYQPATGLVPNFSLAMVQGVWRFQETDHATNVSQTGVPRLKVGKGLHNGTFNALYGDFHVAAKQRSEHAEWVAARH